MDKPEKDAQEREDQVFNDLYRAYSPAIYKLAYRLLGNCEEAGDITQETFSRLYQAIKEGGEILSGRDAWKTFFK